MENPNEKPKLPLVYVIEEGDNRKKCDICGSSLKRRFFFKVLGCLSPKCKNYFKMKHREDTIIRGEDFDVCIMEPEKFMKVKHEE